MKSCPAMAPARRWQILFTFALAWPLAVSAAADANLHARLVKYCGPPPIRFTLGFRFTPTDGFQLMGDSVDEDAEIAGFPQAFAKAEKEPEALAAVGGILRQRQLTNEATRAFTRVKEVYATRLRANSNDIAALIGCGEACHKLDQDEQAEALLRDAVRRAPKEWRTHAALGQFKGAQCWSIFAQKDNAGETNRAPTRPSPEELKRSQAQRREAGELHDAAVRVSDGDADARYHRARFRMLDSMYEPFLRRAHGEQVDTNAAAKAVLNPEFLADVRPLAGQSRDCLAIATIACFEAMMATLRERPTFNEDIWATLPKTSRETIALAVSRLDVLGRELPPPKAAAALEARAILQHMFMNNSSEGIKSARRALELNPARDAARWTLMAIYVGEENGATNILALIEERLRRAESAPWHFYAARACDRLQRGSEAEAHARAGLRVDPGDVHCLLSVAAFDIRRATNSSGLLKAKASLDAVQDRLEAVRPKVDSAVFNDAMSHWRVLASVLLALNDQKEEARALVQTVVKANPDDESFAELAKELP